MEEKLGRSLDRPSSGVHAQTSYQLQINPNLSFNSVNRPFEELPENFLESISPQQNQNAGPQESPQLAPLAPMSLAASDSAYATLAPMSATSSYVSSLKMEPLHDQLTSSLQHSSQTSSLDKLSTGPAGLLSPLHSARSDNSLCSGLLGLNQNGTRTGEMLANLRRPLPYIKEEVELGQDYKPLESSGFISHQSQPTSGLMSQEEQQQELDHRLANAETPPAVSNVELASSFIATMIGEQPPDSPVHQHPVYHSPRRRYATIDTSEMSGSDDLDVSSAGPSGEGVTSVDDNRELTSSSRLQSSAGDDLF